MIRKVTEGKLSWFRDLVRSDIPYPLPKGITIHSKPGEIGIEVQGLVGSLPLLNGETLQITPKIGSVNFLRLLFRAEGGLSDLENEYENFVEYSVDDEGNIDSIVARQLFYSAANILNRSPQKGRVRRRRLGEYAVGNIDAVRTALNIASRKSTPVVYSISERTADIPENRVISEALIRARSLLPESDMGVLGKIYERWRVSYPRSYDLGADLECVERGFASSKYGGARDYYRKSLMLAQVVLGNSGLGFSEAASVEGDAVMLNTSDVFEKYLRNTMSISYSKDGYIVSKGGFGVSSLYTDGSIELHPDIVVTKYGQICLIADAKYKEPTPGDHYQMYAYLSANGLKRGVMLAPLFSGRQVVVREYSTPKQICISVVYLPMDDLNTTEEFLANIIGRFS